MSWKLRPDHMCSHRDCAANYDPRKWPKPPPGWGIVVAYRYRKAEHQTSTTYTLCPRHTIAFVPRQGRFQPASHDTPEDK